MYLRSATLHNIKAFGEATFEFPANKDGSRAGWHVILGRNAAGKSTVLQALAVALVGPVVGAEHLRLADRDAWVRRGAKEGRVQVILEPTPNDTAPKGRRVRSTPIKAGVVVTGPAGVPPSHLRAEEESEAAFDRGPYSGARGWFSAGYGPFRRLTGGQEAEARRDPRVDRHTSLFSEGVALTQCEPWLKELYYRSIDGKPSEQKIKDARDYLKFVRLLLDTLLAPHGMHLGTVKGEGVLFRDDRKQEVELSRLSDGFRSFLALTIDLLRQIIDADEWGEVRGKKKGAWVDTEGVVLIDEVDSHLHPSWQRMIGPALCEVFPKIQFIVTSHSPFVAQSAEAGRLTVLEVDNGHAVVRQPEESVEGWKADDILLSPLFGLQSTRDPETDLWIRRRADLLGLAERSPEQEAELAKLTADLRPRLRAPGDSPAELDADARIEAYLRSRAGRL